MLVDLVPILLPLAGLLAGTALGYVARRNFFCTLSALERYWYADDASGVRSWVLAAIVAAAGVWAFSALGWIRPSSSFYLMPQLFPVSAIAGGLAFGIGMALVGTCGFGALVRLGGGSLKSLMAILVLGITALSTMRGILGLGRERFFEQWVLDFSFAGSQSIPDIASALAGSAAGPLAAALAIGLPAAWVFSDVKFRTDRRAIATGIMVGLIILFGWLATTFLSARSFYPFQIETASFVAPVGDALLQMVTFTGAAPDYGVGMVFGVVLGAGIAARLGDDIRWEACDDARELKRHITGAALMGFGGVLAFGCTIGQGISAASVLAVSVPLTLGSIIIGARIGLAWLLEGSIASAFRR
ncbi:YeeE/YedE family protein [Salaquimonas pukyongi]|uniref:YeeE/YedE family protein n=1 Tax=Salaquimonas pukyongi TaxID=2712698 RepID=UPI00096BBFBF|nr:YeeE/YedE family protein [Salaquimonas pukyongi]